MSLAERRGGNRSVIPDTTRREAEMSTAQEHGNIPSTAVEFAPGLWRTSLQRHDLSVWPPGETVTDRSQGVQSPAIRNLVTYWGTGDDWRRCESGRYAWTLS
jgi:hypothetical protein